MYRRLILFFFIIISCLSLSDTIDILEKYKNFNFENNLKYDVFEKAYLGFLQIPKKSSNLLVIIDYSLPSSEKRFFLLDTDNDKILYNSRVAHSKNSGLDIPTEFSDDPNSFQNSLGFYLTLNDYNGAYGHSLRLKGLEKNINSNAEERAIVLHGGEIANESYLKKYGFLGRSLGCPVLPTDIVDDVISLIKNGTVLFISGNDETYVSESDFF